MAPSTQSENVQYNMSSDSTAIKYQLETDTLAKELKKKMGLKPVKVVEQNTEKIEWQETDRSWMNKTGIENIVGLVRGYADKINTTSQYDARQIEALMTLIHQSVARNIAENWTRYEVGRRGNADNITELVTNVTWSAFNASLDGRKMEIIGDSAETVTRTTQESKDDSGGFVL